MAKEEEKKAIPSFNIEARELAKAVGAVYRAASDDATRPSIQGILIEREGAALRFVATNGHWMAVYTVLPGVVECPSGEWSAIVDRENAVAIMRRAGKSLNGATIDLEAKRVTFADGAVLPLATIDARFPAWRQVYPKEANKSTPEFVGVNFRYLAAIYESFAACIGKPRKGTTDNVMWQGALCIEPSKDCGPMRVTCDGFGALEVIIMPVAKITPVAWTFGKSETPAIEEQKTA